MSEDSGQPAQGGQGGGDWRERIRLYGKRAVTLEEMLRLGFWPPDEDAAQKREQALAELGTVQKELAALRKELAAVEQQIATVGDVDTVLAEIRRRRIERVRAEREARRVAKAREREERGAADRERRRERPPFLGHGVSGGLRYEGGDPERVASLGLPALATARDLAAAIGIDEGALAWLSYHRGAATIDHYHRFTIPKRSGGRRVISSPKGRLRVAQSWVLRHVLEKLALHDAAMAFRPARSIVDNAALHRGRAIVIRIDLKDFFPSIGFRRVKGLFESFGYNEGIATILALLCTEAPRVAVTLTDDSVAPSAGTGGASAGASTGAASASPAAGTGTAGPSASGATGTSAATGGTTAHGAGANGNGNGNGRTFVAVGGRVLPQGACTSPAVTNILCRGMDARLAGLARRFGYTYSRYADDLVFSHPEPAAALGAFLRFVHEVIASEGFTVNADKTRVMRPHQRQAVNGLVVNKLTNGDTASDAPGTAGFQPAPAVAPSGDAPGQADGAVRLSRRDLRHFRAFLHHCKTEGFEAVSARLGKSAQAYGHGYHAYITMVSPAKAAQFAAAHPWLGRGTPGSSGAGT